VPSGATKPPCCHPIAVVPDQVRGFFDVADALEPVLPASSRAPLLPAVRDRAGEALEGGDAIAGARPHADGGARRRDRVLRLLAPLLASEEDARVDRADVVNVPSPSTGRPLTYIRALRPNASFARWIAASRPWRSSI
jgi:hypothetical protein